MRTPNTTISLTGLALAAVLALVAAPAGQLDPSVRERQTMQRVAEVLEHGHLSGRPLDDVVSRRALRAYVEALDPQKLYFTQSDVDEIAVFRNQVDDMLKTGDPRLAHEVFDLFLRRVDERVVLVRELLAGEFDFTLDEHFVTDPDAAQYARDPGEAHERWKRRIKYDLLTLTSAGTDGEAATERLTRRYTIFQDRMNELRRDEVLALFLSSTASAYDPHTTYMSPRFLEDFEIQMRLNYQGIGARLTEEDGYAVIKSIMPGGAAEKHGKLAAGDRIIGVGQDERGPLEDVVGMRLSDVVERIRGEEGTLVRLSILPTDGSRQRVYQLTRARTELRDSAARGEVMDLENGESTTVVGVIELPSFYADMQAARRGESARSATNDVRQILDRFARENVAAVVLDLRNNGGGLLTEAVGVTGLFIDQGPVVMVRDGDDRVRTHHDEDAGTAWDGPLVVLTNRFSASASEIVAGAIADYQRGIVVGDASTHGKGTVQQVLQLGAPRDELGALKLTIQQFYRPGGFSTQLRGVAADIELPSLSAAVSGGESELPRAIAFDEIAPAQHATCDLIDGEMLARLEQRSRARRQSSEDFAALREDSDRISVERQRKNVPLREDEFLAQRRDRAAVASHPDAGDGAMKRDAYLEEVLAIARDYAQLLAVRPN